MLPNILVSKLAPYADKLLEIVIVDINVIRYSEFVRHWRKNGSIMGMYINYL